MSPALRRGVWIIVLIFALIAALWINETRVGRGVLLIIGFVVVVGGAVLWLSGRGSRLPGSGRDPEDLGDAGDADERHQRPSV